MDVNKPVFSMNEFLPVKRRTALYTVADFKVYYWTKRVCRESKLTSRLLLNTSQNYVTVYDYDTLQEQLDGKFQKLL